MNRRIRIAVTFALLTLAAGSVSAWWSARRDAELPALPAAPVGSTTLLYARPFQLAETYVHYWRAEQPEVNSGWILVLQVDPLLAHPREGYNKVLYVGTETAERINHGSESGRIVVLVPALLDGEGRPTTNPATTPVFFGSEALPEEIDAAQIEREFSLALDAGIQAPTADELAQALGTGGELLSLEDRPALDRELARLIRRFSPDPADEDIARGLELPLLR
jgi:hypothetical protein